MEQNTLGQSDDSLATTLKGAAGEVLVIANSFTAVVASRLDSASLWQCVGRGDFGLKCGAAAKARADAGELWWQQVTGSPAKFDVATASLNKCSVAFVEKWLEDAEALTTSASGRGKSLSGSDEDYLGYLAAWRCQFSGCGKDLRTQTATGAFSKSSYFAHIIASSPGGPRGDLVLSHQLSDDVSNYMLLCDECHRRVDRQDPDLFTVDVLREMRQESINEVQRLLSSLQYKDAVPVVLMGNVTGQSPHFVKRAAEEGLWSRKLRMAAGNHHAFLENNWHQHNPHSPAYWLTLFSGFQAELPELRKLLQTQASSGGRDVAVFPLHGTSVLLLAGKVFGEGSATHIFQYRRERPDNALGGKWGYDRGAAPVVPDKYYRRTLLEAQGQSREAAILVSLTFAIEPSRLPSSVYDGGCFQMPTLEVTAEGRLWHDVLDSPQDLGAVSALLGEAVRQVQDDWGVEIVHVFVAAPASVSFKLGQKLQARHHAVFRCYETAVGNGAPFRHTIDIGNDSATDASQTATLRFF
jgi:hypothetical protein